MTEATSRLTSPPSSISALQRRLAGYPKIEKSDLIGYSELLDVVDAELIRLSRLLSRIGSDWQRTIRLGRQLRLDLSHYGVEVAPPTGNVPEIPAAYRLALLISGRKRSRAHGLLRLLQLFDAATRWAEPRVALTQLGAL